MRINYRPWLLLVTVALVTVSCTPASPQIAITPEAATVTPKVVLPAATPAAAPTNAPTEAPTAKPTVNASAGLPTPTRMPGLPQSAAAIQRIGAEELKTLLEGGADLVIVDTRPKSDYADGFIPGAQNLPWAEQIVGARLLPKGKLLVLYGADSADQSTVDVAIQLIEKYGFTYIMLLDGGLQRWLDELGYPYEQPLGY